MKDKQSDCGVLDKMMKYIFKLLIRWQIAVVYFFVLLAFLSFCYLYFYRDLGYYRTALAGGIIMSVVLCGVATIRVIIFALEKLSVQHFGGETIDPENSRIGFSIFLLKYFGANFIAYGYVMAFLSLFVFMVNK